MKTRLLRNLPTSLPTWTIYCILISTIFVSGCLAFPISTYDSETLAKKDALKTLDGESQEDVISKLGIPDQWVSQGEREFMTYSAREYEKWALLMFFIPVGERRGAMYLQCYRLEIDSNNMVKDYKIDTTARHAQDPNCQHLLTNDWELPNQEIRAMRNTSARWQFKEGDLISMTTNKAVTIASTKTTSLKIAVVESDSTKIKGRLSGFLSYVDETMEKMK
jgi:hypothetical protein